MFSTYKLPIRLILQLVFGILTLSVPVHASFKRLGKHSAPSKGATVLAGKFPPPGVLFHHFVLPGTPLLMKGVLNETEFPAFEKWSDDYLREHYGSEIVDVELGKKEDRGGENAPIALSRFLGIYADKDMYMVHTLPESMHGDVMVPYSLRCGGFEKSLHEVVMWFSNGNTSSVLHLDSVDNINCLLDGEKQMVLIDKSHKAAVEETGWVENGGYSEVDVEAVDPDKYPGIASAPWYQINMVKGDCTFIPNGWYHQIYSPPGRNLAVNFWFTPLYWYNSSDCQDIQRENEPLSNFQMASPNQQLRSDFLSQFSGLKFVNEAVFLSRSWCSDRDEAKKLWNKFNINGDKKITWEEFYRVEFDDMVQNFPMCFHDDEKHGLDTDNVATDDGGEDFKEMIFKEFKITEEDINRDTNLNKEVIDGIIKEMNEVDVDNEDIGDNIKEGSNVGGTVPYESMEKVEISENDLKNKIITEFNINEELLNDESVTSDMGNDESVTSDMGNNESVKSDMGNGESVTSDMGNDESVTSDKGKDSKNIDDNSPGDNDDKLSDDVNDVKIDKAIVDTDNKLNEPSDNKKASKHDEF